MPLCPFTNAMLGQSRDVTKGQTREATGVGQNATQPRNLGLNPGGRPSTPSRLDLPKRVQASEAMSITKRYFTSLLSMRS